MTTLNISLSERNDIKKGQGGDRAEGEEGGAPPALPLHQPVRGEGGRPEREGHRVREGVDPECDGEPLADEADGASQVPPGSHCDQRAVRPLPCSVGLGGVEGQSAQVSLGAAVPDA